MGKRKTKKKNKNLNINHKWLIIGAVSALILIGLFITFKTQNKVNNLSQNSSSLDVSTWKTYTNSNYGFSFQYPNYLAILNDKFPKEFPSSGTVDDKLRISSIDHKNDLQIYINPHFGGMCHGVLIYQANRAESGLVFTKTKGDNSGLPTNTTCSSFYEATINFGDGNYLLTTFGYNNNTSAQADFEKILSTFKFTESASSTDTSTWKTYENSYFEVKFPIEMELQKRSPTDLNVDGISELITLVKEGPKGISHYQLIDGLTFSIGVNKKQPNLSLKDYANNQTKPSGSGPLTRDYFKETNIGTLNGYESYITTYSGRAKVFYLPAKDNGVYYYISITTAGQNKVEYENLAEGILNTLKILK